MIEKLTFWVTIMVTVTLCLVVNAMVGVFLYGLFLPNSVIDNKDIFPIIGPSFQTIIGGFIGLLASLNLFPPAARQKPRCYHEIHCPSPPRFRLPPHHAHRFASYRGRRSGSVEGRRRHRRHHPAAGDVDGRLRQPHQREPGQV